MSDDIELDPHTYSYGTMETITFQDGRQVYLRSISVDEMIETMFAKHGGFEVFDGAMSEAIAHTTKISTLPPLLSPPISTGAHISHSCRVPASVNSEVGYDPQECP